VKSDRLTLVARLSLLLPIAFWPFSREGPTVLYPFPLFTFLPLFLIGPAAAAVPVVLFFAWNPGLFHGDATIPKRSYVLLIVAIVLSVLWFLLGWRDGLAVEGSNYNYFMSALNLIWIALLCVIFERCWKTGPSFKMNLLAHWLLFMWLAWYAFPFFGEIT